MSSTRSVSWERQSKFGTLGALEGTGACRGALQTHRIEREKEEGEKREREREREREFHGAGKNLGRGGAVCAADGAVGCLICAHFPHMPVTYPTDVSFSATVVSFSGSPPIERGESTPG